MAFHEGQWLKREVERAKISQSEFARRMGKKVQSVTRWFRQQELRIRGENVEHLAEVLGLSRAVFETRRVRARIASEAIDNPSPAVAAQLEKKPQLRELWRRQIEEAIALDESKSVADMLTEGLPVGDEPLDQNVDPYSEKPWFEVPMFDLAVAAGRWVDVSELGETRQAAQIDRGYFRIHIRGDSMQPAWPDGSVVEFRLLRDGKQAMEIGADYYVQRDGEATFKRLVKISEDELVFAALNKRKYPDPFVVTRSAIVRMAKAEWMLSKPKGR